MTSQAIAGALDIRADRDSDLVRKFYDISTGHLDGQSRHYIEQGGEGLTFYSLDYGWLLYVSSEEHLSYYPEIPQVLVTILERARSFGCAYVMLDADAEFDPDLPTFDDGEEVATAVGPATGDDKPN